GLQTCSINSIMASGLVLTYTTSGIFNFAHGAIAFASAYLYFQLHVGLGLPIVPSLIISPFLFAPLLGLLLDRILLRRLAHGPVYARIVGTIGLLVMLPNFVQWLVITVGIKVFSIGRLGVNAARTSAAAWVMTMVLAGLGGVLIAPLFTLTEYEYTLVVLGALAVVVLGGLRSIPIAFVGGLGLGIVQNWVAGYSDNFLPK